MLEPDLVATRDGVLVARHDNELSGTTDVAARPEFADRRTSTTVDGVSVTGWFTEDFTLAELRTLRAEERLPDVRPGSAAYDGRYLVPTLQEVLDLAARAGRRYGRRIGVAPELKHPTHFAALGLPLEERLVETLRRNGLDHEGSRVWVQSFEERALRDLHERGVRVALVQLVGALPSARPYDHVVSGDPETYADMTTPEGLREIATYADWVAPEKSSIFPRTATGTSTSATTLVADAHAAGLRVVPYTYRVENRFLPPQFRVGSDPDAAGDLVGELVQAYRGGVDAVFTDHPGLAVVARTQVRREAGLLARRAA